jgi:hypothetical protein
MAALHGQNAALLIVNFVSPIVSTADAALPGLAMRDRERAGNAPLATRLDDRRRLPLAA